MKLPKKVMMIKIPTQCFVFGKIPCDFLYHFSEIRKKKILNNVTSISKEEMGLILHFLFSLLTKV